MMARIYLKVCAHLCGTDEGGSEWTSDVQDLVSSLGNTLTSENEKDSDERASSSAAERPLPLIPVRAGAVSFIT